LGWIETAAIGGAIVLATVAMIGGVALQFGNMRAEIVSLESEAAQLGRMLEQERQARAVAQAVAEDEKERMAQVAHSLWALDDWEGCVLPPEIVEALQ